MATKNTIKRLMPKGEDAKFIGSEPEWAEQPTEHNRVGLLTRAFSWYNYLYGRKEAKDLIAQYFEINQNPKQAKIVREMPDSRIKTTTGWICRMTVMGLKLTEHEQAILDEQLAELFNHKPAENVTSPAVVPTVPKPSIQDHLKEKASECAGELEGMFDDFVTAGAKMSADFKPIALIRGMNISPQMIPNITAVWNLRLRELNEVLQGNDTLLVEGYSHLSKSQLKQCVKFCETVIADCGSYISIKKTERKPRAKKAVSPEKQAAKFKYLKEFAELKLRSEPSAKLVNASEAWLYDTVKRKLIHVLADSHLGTFTVKGSAVIAFDSTTTVQKTLRKPADQLKAVMSGGKPAMRKEFGAIKATETKWNGRGNENIIILKAW